MIGVYPRRRPTEQDRATLCLGLWRLADPGNVGTLLRTADAFGASVALSDGLCRSRLAEGAARLGGRDLPRPARPVGRDARRADCALRPWRAGAVRPRAGPPLTFLLGSERDGLPPELLHGATPATIAFPGAAESLNVAAVGAIALYELTRRS